MVGFIAAPCDFLNKVWVILFFLYLQFHNESLQGEALSPLLFSLALEYAVSKVQRTKFGLDMNGTH